jgi:heat-inducible transcriptional repressor
MGVLEREGFLVQPYTSAGRIPTDKGYRFFVDSLAQPASLGPMQSERVRDFFAHAHGKLERMLHDTSQLLSDVTDCAAVVIAPTHEVATVLSVQLLARGPRSALLVVVLSNAAVEKRFFELADEVTEVDLVASSAHLSRFLVGTAFGGGAVVPVPATGNAMVDQLTRAVVDSLRGGPEHDLDSVFVGGAARMAAAFDAVGTIRQVLSILEQQYVLVTLLQDVIDRGQSVAIGTEHGVIPLADCSIVVAPYEVEGELAGTVGVLGPTRMHYAQTLAAVAVISKRLGKALTEG